MTRTTRQRPLLATTASTDLGWEALGALREAHWHAFVRWRMPPRIPVSAAPAWEDEARESVEAALRSAAGQGRGWAGMDNLLEALLTDPHNRANEFLRDNGVRPAFREITQWVWPDGDRAPRVPTVAYLQKIGAVVESAAPPRPNLRARLAQRMVSLSTQASPIFAELEQQAVVEAVRLAHDRVTTAHLVLAVLLFEQQLRSTGLRPRPSLALSSQPLLSELGVFYPSAPGAAAALALSGELATFRRRRAVRTRPGGVPWTAAAASASDRARDLADRSEFVVGSLHLLHAALTERDETARRLLHSLSIQPDEVVAATARRLGLPS